MQLHYLPWFRVSVVPVSWFRVVTGPFPNHLALLGRLLNFPAVAATLVVLVLGLRPSIAQITSPVNFGPISVPATSVIFGPDNVLTGRQLTALGSNGPLGATPAVQALAFPAAPGQVMTFSASGMVGSESVANVGPDGCPPNTSNLPGCNPSVANINSLGSISGYQGMGFALMGVFTNGNPEGAAPADYDYSAGFGQLTYAPLLNQVFFIGDGLTGTGTGSTQMFQVPSSATQLWLGFVDGFDFRGPPAAYGDNPGSLSVSGAVGRLALSCQLTGIVNGPPKQIEITMQAVSPGLNTIQLTSSTNATVAIPSFVAGTTSPVIVTATKINQSESSDVAFTISSTSGAKASCDPVDYTATIEKGPETHTFRKLSSAEHYIRIVNGTPGLSRVTFIVNGKRLPEVTFKSDGTGIVDIGSAMYEGSNDNLVVMEAIGRRGASAFILIGDASVE